MRFPHILGRRRRRSSHGLCCSTGDSNSDSQKKKRVSEGSLLVQDPKEETLASGTYNLRFLWGFSLRDIRLREGSNAVNAREE